MPTIWELNAVLLAHTTHFFVAANMVLERWQDPDEAFLGSLVNLSSNMLWARSSFDARDRAEEKEMAYTGAFLGSVADRALEGISGTRARAEQVLDQLERGIREGHEQLLELLQGQLAGQQLGPGQVNRAVWEALFPRFSHDASLGELCRQIRLCLER